VQPHAARAAEWSWVVLAFVLASLTFASTQPVHPREGLGEEGQIYHAMAKAMPRELPPTGVAPYVYRLGMPLAAATVAKSLDWVIAAGFDRLDLVFGALSVVLLTILLQRHVESMFARLVVIIAFIVEPHSPVRLSYMHPLSTDSAVMAGLLAGLITIEWFHSRPSPARAVMLSLLVAVGVTFHELMLIIGVCALWMPRPADSRGRFAAMERSGAWLPMISGTIALVAIRAWIEPTPSDYSLVRELTRGFTEKSVLQIALAWFLVFGPLLALAAYFWKSTFEYLRERPVFVTYLLLCVVWAWSSRDHIERGFALASPVVYILIARSLALVSVNPASARMAGVLVLQGLSSRVFSRIGGPIETPNIVGEVWERLGWPNVAWALSYQNMWSQLCATTMIPVYVAWYAITAVGVWMLVRHGNLTTERGTSTAEVSRSATLIDHASRRIGAFAARPRKMITVMLLTAVALAPIAWLALSRFYWYHYAQPGAGYLVYNLARVWLTSVLIAAFWSTGARITGAHASRNNRGRSVEFAIAGAAAWSVAVVLLAALHLYYLWLILPMLAVATAFAINDILDCRLAGGSAQEEGRWGLAGILLRFAVAIHALVILVGIALWGHFGGDNDVPGNYLPYYETVLRQHTIAPGPYWVHFFASKGNGLGFLANVLSDVQGAGLATYVMLLLGAGMIWRLAARSTAEATAIGLIGACLFLQYYAGQGAYAKSHIIRNLFVLYIVLSGVRALLFHPGIDDTTKASRLIVIVAIVVLSPLALVLLLPILLIEWALLAWSRRPDTRRSLIETASAIAATAVVCAYNFFQTGLPELHNMPSFMSRFVSVERLSRWMDPRVAYLDYRLAFLQVNLPGQHAVETSAMTFVPSQSFPQVVAGLMTPSTLVLIVASVVGLAIAVVLPGRRTADARSMRVAPAILYIAIVLAMLSALQMFGGGPGSSMGRFTDFANPLGIAIGVIVLSAAWSIEMPQLPRRIFGAAIALAAVAAIYLGSPPVLALSWRDNVGFVLGQSSYARLNDYQWDTLAANRAARSLPSGTRVELLNFLPGFTGIPATPFQRPDGCVYLKDYTSVLYGSPDQSAALYRQYNIDHFLVDVSKDAPIVWSGFSELFTPEVMRSRMRLVSHEVSAARDLYLLTWRDDAEPGGEGFDEFLQRWGDKLAVEKKTGHSYGGFDYGAQRIGRRE
jgi:hypothetical protein